MSRTAAAPNATMSHRRFVMSHSHALLAQPAFHLATNRRETLGGRGLVPGDDHRLRVRRTDQSPAVAEQNTHPVDVDHVVSRAEVFHGALDEAELELFWNFN